MENTGYKEFADELRDISISELNADEVNEKNKEQREKVVLTKNVFIK